MRAFLFCSTILIALPWQPMPLQAQGIYMGRDGRVHAQVIVGNRGEVFPVVPMFCPNGWGPCPVVLAPPLAYAPPPPPAVDALRPPPLGWVYGPYTLCTDPSCKALRLSGRRVQEERLLRRGELDGVGHHP